MIEVGGSYDAEKLAELCGQNGDERYGHYAFVGNRATIIAQDEGNGVVKVVEIIRQTPHCPNCDEKIDTIHTSRTINLVYKDGKWLEEQADHYCICQCPACSEELDPEDLGKLGVPNEIR